MLCLIALLLSACSNSAISPQALDPQVPNEWQKSQANSKPVSGSWLEELADQQLIPLVEEGLANNYQLAQQLAQLEQSRQAVIISGADRWPALSLSADGARRKTVTNNDLSSIAEQYSASLDLSWELDIWGKLNDKQRQARLSYQASLASVSNAQQTLTANIATGWYNAIQAQQLVALLEKRLANVQQNLDIIERGYRQGINQALDVYLSQDTLYQQRSSTAAQQQTLIETISNLQLLLARYPDGQWPITEPLPLLEKPIPVGQPSELLLRRPDLQQAWFNLLAADAALAVAHKQRFPSLTLVASGSDNNSELQQLLRDGPLGWSLLGGITQPLFAGGRLKATEQQARSQLKQAEQQYLEAVYSAFSEVETAISRNSILADRYQSLLASEASSQAAYSLSFQQYQRGLVSYTTVLESQRRAFDAQTNVIQLRFQLLQNRIALHLALGGDFNTP
jgi:NodT family efflux transporter outer membrane factor (OMF) lipoprotein